jgi:hypothetical protein
MHEVAALAAVPTPGELDSIEYEEGSGAEGFTGDAGRDSDIRHEIGNLDWSNGGLHDSFLLSGRSVRRARSRSVRANLVHHFML